MYSGITILYLLFLKKQFSCVSDGLAIIGARCVLHVTALVLLSLSAGNQDLNSNLLALTYIFVVVINRGSTYILTRGLIVLKDNSYYSNLSYKFSLFFSIAEVYPAFIIILVYTFFYTQILFPILISTLTIGFWFWYLKIRGWRLGRRIKIFKQYIALSMHISLPTQFFINTIESKLFWVNYCSIGLLISIGICILTYTYLTAREKKVMNMSSTKFPVDCDNTLRDLFGVRELLRPRYFRGDKNTTNYIDEIKLYLDLRIPGFSKLKSRYIKYYLS
jgi:hypothetical protein